MRRTGAAHEHDSPERGLSSCPYDPELRAGVGFSAPVAERAERSRQVLAFPTSKSSDRRLSETIDLRRRRPTQALPKSL